MGWVLTKAMTVLSIYSARPPSPAPSRTPAQRCAQHCDDSHCVSGGGRAPAPAEPTCHRSEEQPICYRRDHLINADGTWTRVGYFFTKEQAAPSKVRWPSQRRPRKSGRMLAPPRQNLWAFPCTGAPRALTNMHWAEVGVSSAFLTRSEVTLWSSHSGPHPERHGSRTHTRGLCLGALPT